MTKQRVKQKAEKLGYYFNGERNKYGYYYINIEIGFIQADTLQGLYETLKEIEIKIKNGQEITFNN